MFFCNIVGRYVDDLEVRQALQAVRNRINELADRTDEKVNHMSHTRHKSYTRNKSHTHFTCHAFT